MMNAALLIAVVLQAEPLDHWAFRPPVRPPLPEAGAGKNPIDALLEAEQARRGLRSLPPADPAVLARRVTLDLTGLPPTREELHAFLADPSSAAYERLVDRLLASPAYGERWGRHWMDIWRYSDWYGLDGQVRNGQKHLWHWRDWIVESLNADRPYDRMLVEMLAADEVAPEDPSALRATGFLVRNYFLFNRTTWLDTTVENVGRGMLGMTFQCAKCHDHKYDPISHVDYYRLRAVFEPHQVRIDSVPGQTDLEKDGIPRAMDMNLEAPTYLHESGDEKRPDTRRAIAAGVPERMASFGEFRVEPVSLPAAAYAPGLRPFVLEDHLREAGAQLQAARAEVEKRQEPPGTPPEPGPLQAQDDFASPNPELWEKGPGDWEHAAGHLVQSRTGDERAWLALRRPPPADFEATLRFKTTGGRTWRSVGLTFDAHDGREKLVYLSACSEAKLQVSYAQGAGHVYPKEGAQRRPVEVGREVALGIRVRGPLVNVAVDGRHALAYRLPVEREPGRIEVIAYDAAVEFLSFELRELPAAAPLVEPGKAAPPTPEEARAALTLAEKRAAAAELKIEALKAAHAADAGRAPAADAALAERRWALARAEADLLGAGEKDRPKFEKALAEARAALENPGDRYTSLRAAVRAPEGPDETDESRRRPFPPTSTGRRTALARWIVDRGHPLTARVAVNHVWTRHFGRPLTEPVDDFGRRAPAPPLLPLLDFLAVELMEGGWRTKRLHRLIVTSEAYRRSGSSTGADPATVSADPEGRFLWKRLPVRMESQVVRDSVLHLAGALDLKLGGPSIDPRQQEGSTRRSLYFAHSRDDRHRFVAMFDDADIEACYRRSETIAPQQALAMANSALTMEMAQRIAARLPRDGFIEAAFETVLAAPPTPAELSACREALGTFPEARAREILLLALLNHNDFITIR